MQTLSQAKLLIPQPPTRMPDSYFGCRRWEPRALWPLLEEAEADKRPIVAILLQGS